MSTGALIILITGPQGSGKTTQAKLLARSLNLPVITTGDAMRQLAKKNTPDGRKVRKLLDLGQMVPDEIVEDYVRRQVLKKDYQRGFVMDGYPRTVSQLKFFDPGFDKVFYLDISDELAVQRLLQRGREDDTATLIKERLKLYHQRTKLLLSLYSKQGILSRVDGLGSISEVSDKIREDLKLSLMRKSGEITAAALKKAIKNIKVGISSLELNNIIDVEIKRLGGQLSFLTVPGYKWASCVNFNEQVVHGIPTDRKVQEGDLVSIDLGAVYKGWHTDAAWTKLVGDPSVSPQDDDKRRFLEVGEKALWKAIAKAIEGNRIGDISSAIQQEIENAGYSVVRSLVGHGVGKALHEEPEVPGYGEPGLGLELKAGMTLAVEVIYTMGQKEVVLDQDGWTIKSADNSVSGLFEMTVAVGKDQAEVLTKIKL